MSARDDYPDLHTERDANAAYAEIDRLRSALARCCMELDEIKIAWGKASRAYLNSQDGAA
jgi:hypothetical protein